MRLPGLLAALLGLVAGASIGRADTHWQVQAVDATGHAAYAKVGAVPTPANRITLEGVLLNNPEDMLNTAYNAPGFMGAQWQVFIQGEGNDHAGTAIWMGQKYSMMGDVDYAAGEWAAEIQRVGSPGGHLLRAGDRVRVSGYALDRNGKVNINERHSTSELLDFNVEWLGTTPGLPAPEIISLAQVRTPENIDIFDPLRLTGGEYYQGRLVRINDVHLAGGTWAPNQLLTIADDTGRTLPVRLGLNSSFLQPVSLGATFDVVGIFNQENGYTSGYQIWVMGYDGSSNLLGVVPEPATMLLAMAGAAGLLARRRR